MLYIIWNSIFLLYLGFLSQSIASYCLEGLLNVDPFFSASFKVRDIIFSMTPLLSSFGGNCTIFQVNLLIIKLILLSFGNSFNMNKYLTLLPSTTNGKFSGSLGEA